MDLEVLNKILLSGGGVDGVVIAAYLFNCCVWQERIDWHADFICQVASW